MQRSGAAHHLDNGEMSHAPPLPPRVSAAPITHARLKPRDTLKRRSHSPEPSRRALRAQDLPTLPYCGAAMIFEHIGVFGSPPVTLRLVTDIRQVTSGIAPGEHPPTTFQMSEMSLTLPFSSLGTG